MYIAEQKYEYSVALPANKLNGEFLSELHVFFGGYTLGPEHEGVWYDEKTRITHRDIMRPVYVALKQEEVDTFFDLLSVFNEKEFDQIALYVKEPCGVVNILRR